MRVLPDGPDAGERQKRKINLRLEGLSPCTSKHTEAMLKDETGKYTVLARGIKAMKFPHKSRFMSVIIIMKKVKRVNLSL